MSIPVVPPLEKIPSALAAGLVKVGGSGVLAAATAGTDYFAPDANGLVAVSATRRA